MNSPFHLMEIYAEVAFSLPGHVAGDVPGKIHQILDTERALVGWGDSLWGIHKGSHVETWGEVPTDAGAVIGGGRSPSGILLMTKNEGGARIFCLDSVGAVLWELPLSARVGRGGLTANGNVWTVEKWAESGKEYNRVCLLALPDGECLAATEVLSGGFIPWMACTSTASGVVVAHNSYDYEAARIGMLETSGQRWVDLDCGDVVAVVWEGDIIATVHDWESPLTCYLWRVDPRGRAQKIASRIWEELDCEPIFGYEGGAHLFNGNTWLRTSITDLVRARE
ncbi:MAG: hypothetical protein Q4C87_05600 [Actinomycetaceae bacterium]|nr:hypothetical protein [Actinomycetaceae bacterium]